MDDESVYAERSLRAGAKGYIGKKEPPQKLLQAIRDVLQGEISLSAAMTRQILHAVGGDRADRKTSPFRELSDREFEVIELIYDGKTNQQICDLLFIAMNTVKRHVTNAYFKLDVNSRSGAITVLRAAMLK